MTPTIKLVDLFAGAGGLSAGFHSASTSYKSVAAVESDRYAAASFEATFGKGIVFPGSIEDWLESGSSDLEADVVIGGPPCQGFSTLGKQDAEDERNTLWRHYAQTLVKLRPKYFVVENVTAFGKSSQYQQFVDETAPGGSLREYSFEYRIMNAADFGAAQARKRAVLIGHRRDVRAPEFPTPSHSAPSKNKSENLKHHPTVRDILGLVPRIPDRDDVLSDTYSEFFGQRMPGIFALRDLHWSRSYTKLSQDRFEHIPSGGNRFDLPEHLLAQCWKRHKSGSGDVMGRLHWDRPSVTIRTEFFKPEKGRYLHPEEQRAITHYEAALLQGFPETHRFVGSRVAIAKQIGNAVPIPLGRAIGTSIAKMFQPLSS